MISISYTILLLSLLSSSIFNVANPLPAKSTCGWIGHCLGDKCKTYNDCYSDWICKKSQCVTKDQKKDSKPLRRPSKQTPNFRLSGTNQENRTTEEPSPDIPSSENESKEDNPSPDPPLTENPSPVPPLTSSTEDIGNLNTTQTPSIFDAILDVNHWKVQLPLKKKFLQVNLTDWTESISEYIDVKENVLILRVPADGGHSKSSTTPRTELRAIGAEFRTGTAKKQMSTRMSIIKLPLVKPMICISQLILKNQPNPSAMMVIFRRESLYVRNYEKVWTKVVSGIGLGEIFTFRILVDKGNVNFFFNGSTTPAVSFADDHTGAMFKLGNYMLSSVDNGELPNTESEVHIFAAEVNQ